MLIIGNSGKVSFIDDLRWMLGEYAAASVGWVILGFIAAVFWFIFPLLGAALAILFWVGPLYASAREWKTGSLKRRLGLLTAWTFAIAAIYGIVDFRRQQKAKEVALMAAAEQQENILAFIPISLSATLTALSPISFDRIDSLTRADDIVSVYGSTIDDLSWARVSGKGQFVQEIHIHMGQDFDKVTNEQQLHFGEQVMDLINQKELFQKFVSTHEWGKSKPKHSFVFGGGFGLIEFSTPGSSRSIEITLGKENFQVEALTATIEKRSEEKLATYLKLINQNPQNGRMVEGASLKKVDIFSGTGLLEVQVNAASWESLPIAEREARILEFRRLWATNANLTDPKTIKISITTLDSGVLGGTRYDGELWVRRPQDSMPSTSRSPSARGNCEAGPKWVQPYVKKNGTVVQGYCRGQ